MGRIRLVRLVGGAENLQLFAVSGISAVLVTRGFLAMAGYPQVGGRGLHIAHMLWGGLLLVIALLLVLTFIGGRRWAALIGGVGFGLFIDEIGKFVTQTNNYFYRPAAALIYVAFAILVVLARQLRITRPLTERERLGNAAFIAMLGLVGGLTPTRRQAALQLVEPGDETHEALRRLLEAAPGRPESRPGMFGHAWAWVRQAADWLLGRRWFVVLVVGVFMLQAAFALLAMLAVGIVLAGPKTADQIPELGATVATTISSSVAAVIAMAGVLRMRRHRAGGYEWLQVAVTLDILITQPFNFTLNQFEALAGLAFDLVVYGVVTRRLHRYRASERPAAARA